MDEAVAEGAGDRAGVCVRAVVGVASAGRVLECEVAELRPMSTCR
jgi:hypothetical protein